MKLFNSRRVHFLILSEKPTDTDKHWICRCFIFAIFLLHEIPGVKELLGGVIILGVAFYATVTNNKKF